MKRIGHLFERIVEPDNLRLAFIKASRGKRQRDAQVLFQRNLDCELHKLREGLLAGDYPIGDYRRFTIWEPKEREICAASFGERVLHHALMNVCEPYFDSWLVPDTYACRKGKGQLKAVQRAQVLASRHAWFLKGDFRKYFDSIPHDRLLALLERKFKDPVLLFWFRRIVESYEKTPGRGLPIGNLTSQHFANLYLDRFDRFRQDVPYVRYMDDFVFWSDDKEELLALRQSLERFVAEELGLSFKACPFVNRTCMGMDFLGMRVFPSTIHLNHESKARFRRKFRAYEKVYARGEWTEEVLQARVTALTAFTEQVRAVPWRRRFLADCEERRGVPREPRRQLEQQRAELPLREPQQEPAVQPQQQPRLPPLLLRSTAGFGIPRGPRSRPVSGNGTNDTSRTDASSAVERFGSHLLKETPCPRSTPSSSR